MPTSAAGRAYTSYEVYKDYNSDDLLNEQYPMGRVYTPLPGDRACTPQFQPQAPLNGLQQNGTPSPGRPSSRSKSPARPQTRHDVAVQFAEKKNIKTEKKSRPLPCETQYQFAIPDQLARPTSPVQRLLERSNTQPYVNLQAPSVSADMDPITRQYYHRLWKTQAPPTDVNLNRYGRAGGIWRHVRACVANTGTQLAFIDGTVKQEDNIFFPPWHKSHGSNRGYSSYHAAGLPSNFVPQTRRIIAPKSAKSHNQFNTHAKSGFKYWYQEPKPIDLRGTTTRLRARIVGNGY